MWEDSDYEEQDDGSWDDIQKLLTGSSAATSSRARPDTQAPARPVLPEQPVCAEKPPSDLHKLYSTAVAEPIPEKAEASQADQPLESYDISDEEEEVENEETVTELEKGTELLQAKPKMMARPSRQPARDTSREPPLAWKEPFNSPQVWPKELMHKVLGKEITSMSKPQAASEASNRNKAKKAKKRKAQEASNNSARTGKSESVHLNQHAGGPTPTSKAWNAACSDSETQTWPKQAQHHNGVKYQEVQTFRQADGQAKKAKHAPRCGQQEKSEASLEFGHAGNVSARDPTCQSQHVDCFGRSWNMSKVVVNFLNVGFFFGTKVMVKEFNKFDWEGVRRCVRFLKTEMKLQVTGVIPENYKGQDNGSQSVPMPADIKNMCETIEETPRTDSQRNQLSADDEMTIKCAYRRACRFLDNDNYREWSVQLHDPKARTWLQRHKDLAHMRYYFDRGVGTFEVLGGNYPMTSLVQNEEVQKHDLCNMGRG